MTVNNMITIQVKVFLLSTDLSTFKYEEFIKVLDVVNRWKRFSDR